MPIGPFKSERGFSRKKPPTWLLVGRLLVVASIGWFHVGCSAMNSSIPSRHTVGKPMVPQQTDDRAKYPYPAQALPNQAYPNPIQPRARVAQGFGTAPQSGFGQTPVYGSGTGTPSVIFPSQSQLQPAPPPPSQLLPNQLQPGQVPIYPAQPGQIYSPVVPVPQGQQGLVPMGPDNTVDLDVIVPPSTGTGKLRVGGTYGTDNGLVGQIIIDERDFDITRFPRNFRDLASPGVFKGAGQHFRLEVVPGQDLERYLVSLSFPYFRNTDWSLGLSGYYFDRQFFDWDEQRAGGRVSLGRRLNEFLSINADLRLENVEIDNPRVGTSPQLNTDLGNHDLYIASLGLVYDDRVQQFLTTEGTYLGLTFRQGFGDYDFSRGEIDFRNHELIYQRPDGSGRHTIGYRTKLGFSGSDTPVFENFFGGGMTSLRGFEFRGISPIDGGVRVGGEFQWLNSLEYFFPLTQDDMIYGTMFVDFGTVEENIELTSGNFRVAPGLGLRVNLPFAGMGGAPFNIDFAFPVETGTGDEEQTVSIFIGVMR